MPPRRKSTSYTIVLIGLLSGMVLVLSMLSIPVGELTRFHFGNLMCLLGGLLFGPLVGGLSAGLGSMLYDFTNPLYTPEFWITFITKFVMGFVAGVMSHYVLRRLPLRPRFMLSAMCGSASYIVLYIAKNIVVQRFVKLQPWVVVWPIIGTKAFAAAVNGLIAVVGSVLLALALRPALQKAGLILQESPEHKH